MKKKVVIVGNGTISKKILSLIQPQDYIIGVDRAAYWLIQQGVIPDVSIGDFDSATPKEFKIIQQSVKNIQRFPKDKNQTDMELAVDYAVKQKPSDVVFLGGIGSRMDHTMATWELLDRLLTAHIPHVLVNEKNSVRLLGQGRTILISRGEYNYISVFPYTKKITLSLSGFRYNLPKTTLIRGTTRAVSNHIASGQAEITIFTGKAWVIESND